MPRRRGRRRPTRRVPGPDRLIGLITALAESDCERLGDGFLAQPVNALTSLGYVAAAGAVVVRSRRRRDEGPVPSIVAGMLALVGVGSFLFHGPQPAGARWLHDWSIVLLLLAMAAWALAIDGVLTRRRVMPASASAASVAGGVLLVAPGAGLGLIGASVVGVLLVEAVGPRDRIGPAVVVVLGVALAAQLLGRADGPLCEPESWLQPHALWHVLTAACLAVWIDRAAAGSRVR